MGELPPHQLGGDVSAGQVRGQGDQELLLKEALHIQMTHAEELFNWDRGLEIPGCWTVLIRRQEGRSNRHRPLTSNYTPRTYPH